MMPRIRKPVVVAGLLAVAAATWFVLRTDPDRPPSGSDPGVIDAPPVPDPAPPDPRVGYPTPFRNVRPEVGYIGDEACARCHPGIAASYHAHPMGRSAEPASRASPLERFDPTAHTTFRVGAYELRVEQTRAGMVHRVSARDAAGNPLPDYAVTPDLAVGSGTRGRSYLTVEKGAVWQSPISWFTAAGRWDLSPGFDLGTGGRRAIIPNCLFCHLNRADPVPGATNRYREPFPAGQLAIGCERCHGPGELHAAERSRGVMPAGPDTSVVNPKHLPPDLRASVCAQCHLQGQERVDRRGRRPDEYRPGLPFELFVTAFVRDTGPADGLRSVGQFEQLEKSRCFTATGGRLGCTSCHDPHAVPPAGTRDRHYRGRCLTCHESKGCSEPLTRRQEKGDSCIGCHMPRADSSNVAHASVTDHRIPRRPARPGPPHGAPPGGVPLVPFRIGPLGATGPELERDLGIALARLASRTPPPTNPAAGSLPALAVDRLTAAQALWPGDVSVRLARSTAEAVRGRVRARLVAATAAAGLAPDSEDALAELATATILAGKYADAARIATRLVEMSPTSVPHLVLRANAFIWMEAWDRAEADCRAALAIHPLHPEARLLLGVCLHRRGDPAGGRKEAETATALSTTPGERDALLRWYKQRTR